MENTARKHLIKRMIIMLIVVGIVFGGIFGMKAIQAQMTKKYLSFKMPPATVTAMKAEMRSWQPQLNAVGSLRAVRGVDVTSEIAGLVRSVNFASGDSVKEGKVLVELNADADVALLRSLEAAADLANTNYERDKKQFEVQAVSQAALDAEAADLRSKRAQVDQQRAIVDKKTIRAPFGGRLGITTVNPGQYINPGDKIVTLQALDTLYVDFYLPQQELSRIRLGQAVAVASDTYPDKMFEGKVTSVNPRVDPDTRNFQVEALIANRDHALLPGMFATVEVKSGAPQKYLTLPQTAVTYNPYGDTIFIIEESGTGQDNKRVLTAKQTFITVGEKRGDQVAILSGLKEGETVVTSGQLKLKNGSPVVIDNKVQPENEAAPKPEDQ
ncbi:MAG TPA: efflux RND transporter periplasmic adaptor subunit [Nitrospirota bacterium]|nr:efflux RND transporter periplasmic adaptor subunit [Nitrospirota bacterium]